MRKRRRTHEPPTNTRGQMGSSSKGMKAWFLVPQISDVLSCAKAIPRSRNLFWVPIKSLSSNSFVYEFVLKIKLGMT